jgi:hypothetical protein
MWIWISALVLLLGTGLAQAQDCTLQRYDSLPLDVYPDRLLVSAVFGTVPKKLELRLENATSSISAESAEALGLHFRMLQSNIKFERYGETVTRLAWPFEMRIGRQILRNMEFFALSTRGPNGEVVGDLGTRLFDKVDLELDISGKKLDLFLPDHCPGAVVHWTKEPYARVPLVIDSDLGMIRAEVSLDGKPITVALSTAGQSRIGMNAMRRLFNVDETSPDLTVVDQDLLGKKVYRYSFKALTADGLTISNPAIFVYDEPPGRACGVMQRCLGQFDAVLGLSVLSKLHLYISRKEKILYLTAAGTK